MYMSSLIHRDNLLSYSFETYKTDIMAHYNSLLKAKNSILENKPSWFSSIDVTYTPSTGASGSYNTAELILYDRTVKLLTIRIREKGAQQGGNNNRNWIYVIPNTLGGEITIEESSTYSSTYYYNLYLNILASITYGNDFISFAFEDPVSTEPKGKHCGGVILVKTVNGDIAVIKSDVDHRGSCPPHLTAGYETYIQATTINTTNTTRNTSRLVRMGQESMSEFADTLLLSPIPVLNSDDLCLNTYYSINAPYLFDCTTEGVFEIAGNNYYSNGVIYVKLNG